MEAYNIFLKSCAHNRPEWRQVPEREKEGWRAVERELKGEKVVFSQEGVPLKLIRKYYYVEEAKVQPTPEELLKMQNDAPFIGFG